MTLQLFSAPRTPNTYVKTSYVYAGLVLSTKQIRRGPCLPSQIAILIKRSNNIDHAFYRIIRKIVIDILNMINSHWQLHEASFFFLSIALKRRNPFYT